MHGMEEVLQKAKGLLEEHGIYIQHVGGSRRESGFSYSVGLSNLGHPEIVMVGFQPDLCQQLINDVHAKIVDGEDYSRPCLAPEIIKNFEVAFRPLENESVWANTGIGQIVLGKPFDAVQMYLPDPSGRFPWDKGCDSGYVMLQQGPFRPTGPEPGTPTAVMGLN